MGHYPSGPGGWLEHSSNPPVNEFLAAVADADVPVTAVFLQLRRRSEAKCVKLECFSWN
jgi:hypothetical protein